MDVGQQYKDFIATKVLPIEELGCTLRELVHGPSGARVMHIENDDPENLFCLSFETLPYNSNGVAHILEHTVLCGSKKYPIKDPFFAMTRRSLNTFMNALTGADFTCYPAASQVEKDYYNLLEVYLDAVFHPELKKMSFLQEGHRLEFSDPKDPSSPLVWKGIVLNEMKGALMTAETRLWHGVMEHLVPDLTYSYVSGGDPWVIPTLTYEELLAFHEIYYHPSRCLFFFYGSFDLKKHLDFIAEKALAGIKKQEALPPIPKQERFSSPVYQTMPYPVGEADDLSKKAMISFAWLTVPVVDQEAVLALTVLDAILMETDASLLKLPLLQSGLCVSADAFMDTDMSEVPYVIICKGCRAQDASALEEALKKSLEKIIEEKISPRLVEAAIHQIEFARTEISGDQAPFGLTLFMRSALARQHGCPPENALMVHSLFDRLLAKCSDPDYLPGIIREHLLLNRHFVRLVMTPDPHLASEEVEREKKHLAELKERLAPEQAEAIVKQGEELALYQKGIEGQSIECLPKVSLTDVPVLARDFKLLRQNNVFSHDCFTNRIVYADLVLDLPHIPEEDLPYIQLLSSLIPEMGADSLTYTEALEYLQAHTGGLISGLSLHVQSSDSHVCRPAFLLRGKALHRKSKELFDIMKAFVSQPRLDEEKRVEELVMQIHTSLQSKLSRSALRYATQLALSGFSPAAKVSQMWHGLDYLKTIQGIAENLEVSKLIKKLKNVQELLLSGKNPHLVLACEGAMRKNLEKEGYFGLLDLPERAVNPWTGNYNVPPVQSQGRVIAAPVAFTCEAFKVCTYIHPHAPALSLAAHILDNKFLHPKIREQGGAYGCGANYTSMTGHFTFHSYRDPHIARTLKAFDASVAGVAAGKFDDRDLEEAKLGMIQQLDSPVAPGSRAAAAYVWLREGKTVEMRQKMRDALLGLTKKEVQLVVEKELLPKKGQGVVVSLAGRDLLEKENERMAPDRKPLPIFPI